MKALKKKAIYSDTVLKSYASYRFTRINCFLLKRIAISILDRSKLINGDMLRNFNYQFHDEFVLDFDMNSYVMLCVIDFCFIYFIIHIPYFSVCPRS